ncbi:galactoside O-acetyltransferase [Reichenbachiella sp. 5M10]|uniref:acyltransferase n=1 Tax=Reichenbachiella sp. 5M10 TaxID=1889772 RepID=UPI000C158C5D|nr:acyltransferase [Reichenbachiella sp. 5M10]PIB36603.1 galactoside O-acetyltransferase [Reichenbachiella sp. 5M10]
MGFLSETEISELGLHSYGTDVLISDKATLYGTQNISIGNHVRIDDFCVLSAGSGGIEIQDYVHIACFCSLIGKGKITMKSFSGLSSRVSLYSSNDDYSGNYLTNPTVPEEYTNVSHGDVTLEKHVIIGAGSIVLPNTTIGEGTAIGSLSLVTRNCDGQSIYLGSPLKKIKSRKTGYEKFEREITLKHQ